MLCFQLCCFQTDLREMARSCSNLLQATNCTNMAKTASLKCSTGVAFGYLVDKNGKSGKSVGG